jgi:MerR family transcriptional regulator/heat shock protein HspR
MAARSEDNAEGIRRTITERRTRTTTTRADGSSVQRSTTRVEVSSERGVFMISVAAELAEMHPQTLRMYEARGLIEPKRSPKGTRLYSHKDVERLRRIQEMTAELGMNLAGVERVFELEEELEAMTRKVRALEKRASQLSEEVKRLEKLRRELRADIVPYMKGGEIVRAADLKRFKINVQRPNG